MVLYSCWFTNNKLIFFQVDHLLTSCPSLSDLFTLGFLYAGELRKKAQRTGSILFGLLYLGRILDFLLSGMKNPDFGINSEVMQEYITELESTNRNPITIHNKLYRLHKFFTFTGKPALDVTNRY
jgi:hypothetical protein